MAIILIPHQPIDFTYRENEPCENLSDMCLQYETTDNPMFQVKRSGSSVPLVTIAGTGATEFGETSINPTSQGNNYFTYQVNFADLGITSGCFELCVYEATGSTLVTNGTFGSDLAGWTVADGLILSIESYASPSGDETCDGEVDLSVIGGTPAYTYSMDGVIYQISDVITGLCYGIDYTFYVKDSYGVIAMVPFTFQDCSSFADSDLFDLNNIYLFEVKECYLNDFE